MELPRDVYLFGEARLDVLNLRLTVNGELRSLEPKTFRTLQFLVENRHRVASKVEILSVVWEGTAVSDNSLTRAIAQIRKALDDDPRQPRYVETVQTVGYRFLAEVAPPALAPIAEVPLVPAKGSRLKNLLIRTSGWIIAGTLAVVTGVVYRNSHPPQNIDSIAVLPFVNVGSNPETEYLSDGITESLRDSLSELANLKVMSRSAVARYKGKDVDARSAGQELGVSAVLSGRITQQGENLIVSAELVDVAGNSQLWGERYNRKPADALTVQGEITFQVVDRLRPRLSNAQREHLTTRQTTNKEAYQAYLKGRYFAAQFTQEGLSKGFAYLRQAIALDPKYALAYDGLAYYYAISDDITAAPSESMPRAKEAARKALELDDSLVEAHVELGTVYFFYDFDWSTAEREFRRAIALNPGYAPAHLYYGWYLTALGRVEEGLREGRRAVELDPLSAEIHAILGWNLYFARRYDEAGVELRKSLEIDPDYPLGLYILGQVYAQQKRFDDAITTQQKAAKLFGPGGDSWPLAEIARDYFLAGKPREAHEGLQNLLANSQHTHVTPFGLATIYAALGEKDQAFAQLEQAYTQRSWFLDNLAVDPELDSLRADPRFKGLSARMNLR